MDTKLKTKAKGTVAAVVIRADGTREDLGVIASTEDGTLSFGEKVKQAWREGWQEGKQKKDCGGE
jgi:hypothetical protein